MECCCAAAQPALQYWQKLHSFTLELPSVLNGAAAACVQQLLFTLRAIVTALWSAVCSVLVPILTWLLWLLTNNATLIIVGLSLFILWQTYYPAKCLRLLSQLQFCRGVIFEFPPPYKFKDVPKYAALTLDGGPCPYNTEPVLDLLAQHDCKATFFVIGSQVEKCDALGVGNGHAELGKATLRRMVAEGHELGNQAWSTRPSHTASPKQLCQEVADMHKLISSTRLVALAAGEDDEAQPQQLSSFRRRKWFRPAGGWFNNAMVDAVQRLGYTLVLGSVFPWDTHIKWPLLNALYIWSKVYSGAVIVLHDRRKHLLPTLQYVLPWLRSCGYLVVTLGEAASLSSQGQAELTSDALTAHNEALGSSPSLQGLAVVGQGSVAAVAAAGAQRSSSGSGAAVTASKPDSLMMNADKLQMSGAYMAQLAKERERAALIAAAEEEERNRVKATKRAQADKRAGIDRRLADMSAAEKRAIERREREKKEAEKRRARRKAEEIVAREAYDTHVRQKAQQEVERREAEAAAAAKAQQDEERKRTAVEAYKKRQEAERAAAAELRARLQAEQEAAEAAEAEAAAAAAAAAAITPAGEGGASLAKDSFAGGSVSGSGAKDKKQLKAKLGGLMKKLGGKIGSKMQGSSKAADPSSNAAAAAAAAGVAAVGLGGAVAAAAVETPRSAGAAAGWEGLAAGAVSAVSSHHSGAVAAAGSGSSSAVFGDATYAWYGLTPGPDSQAALTKIDAVLVQQTAAITEAMQAAAAAAAAAATAREQPSQAEPSFSFDTIREHSFAGRAAAAAAAYEAALPAPSVGRYALGPTGKVLFGFDAQPLLLSQGPDSQAVVLNSQGEAVTGPGGEQMALLLGALGKPLVDPHGRPVLCALDPKTGRPLGVHPDGSIIMVPAAPGYIPASAAAVAEKDRAVGAAGDAAAAATPSDASSSIKEAGSYAPSLARTSSRSHMSGATAATGGAASGTAAGDGTAPPSIASSAVPGELHQLPAEAAPFLPRATAAAGPTENAATATAAAVAVPAQAPVMVPAELLLGPHGMPLLGLDNRPLVVAVDEEGVPLVLGPEGSVLLGPDLPLQLAYSSDGSLVALDSQCRPLTGPDGKPRVVALDRHRRPMVDESGRPVLLTLGPNGLPLPDSHAPSGRVSWAGSASGARLSHSGTQGNLALAAGPGTGLEVMVGTGVGVLAAGGDVVGVVDAADYGQYSAASLGVVCQAPAGAGQEGAEERQLLFSHERVLQQRLLVQEEEEETKQAGAAAVPAVPGAYAAAGCSSEPAAAAAASVPVGAAVSAVATGTGKTPAASAAADDDVSAAHSISRDQADKLSGAVPSAAAAAAAAADGLHTQVGLQVHSEMINGGAAGETLPVKAAGALVHDQQSVELTASATLELAAAAAAANSRA